VKLSSLFFALLALCLTFGSQAQAQTLSAETPIAYGEMVVAGSGTVTIPTSSDTRSSTGAIALVGSALVSRGSVTIMFTPGAQVVISIPPSVLMTGANAPTLTPTIEGGSIQTIPPGGSLIVFFGGTITFSTSGATGAVSVLVPVNVDPL
jgi:Mat/Ecp fimbriae major subunit